MRSVNTGMRKTRRNGSLGRAVLPLVAAVAMVPAVGAVAPSEGVASPARTSRQNIPARWTTATLEDQEAGNVPAIRVLVPAGWKTQGVVRWVHDRPAVPIFAQLRTESPDGAMAFETISTQPFMWFINSGYEANFPPGSKYKGTVVCQPVDALTALKTILLPTLGRGDDVRVVKEEQFDGNAAKIRIEYRSNGKLMEEDLSARLEYHNWQIGFGQACYWAIDYIYCYAAEKGTLDANVQTFRTMAGSIQPDPVWFAKYRRVSDYMVANDLWNTRQLGELSRAFAQASGDLSDELYESWKARSDTQDRMADRFCQSIRGVDEYTYQGSSIELPQGFDTAWTNGLGDYRLGDVNYNPNETSNLNWHPMGQVR